MTPRSRRQAHDIEKRRRRTELYILHIHSSIDSGTNNRNTLNSIRSAPCGDSFVQNASRKDVRQYRYQGGIHMGSSADVAGENTADRTTPIVLAKDVTKTYDTGKVKVEALRGINLSVQEGEMIAVMGPSGCGKTTLLNCLSGLDDLTSGDVRIRGRPKVL